MKHKATFLCQKNDCGFTATIKKYDKGKITLSCPNCGDYEYKRRRND